MVAWGARAPPSRASELSHGEFVAVGFVDRKPHRDVTVRGITDIVQVSLLEGILTKDQRSGLQPWFDQLEHRQVKGECAVNQQQIDLATDILERLKRVAFADIHQIAEARRVEV